MGKIRNHANVKFPTVIYLLQSHIAIMYRANIEICSRNKFCKILKINVLCLQCAIARPTDVIVTVKGTSEDTPNTPSVNKISICVDVTNLIRRWIYTKAEVYF